MNAHASLPTRGSPFREKSLREKSLREKSLREKSLREINLAPGFAVTIAFAFVSTAFLFGGCTKSLTEEEKIRAVLAAGVVTLEDGDSAGAADLLSETYRDKSKRDKRALKQLAFFLLRRGPVRIALREIKVVMEPNATDAKAMAAKVTLTAVVVQGSADIKGAADLLPQSGKEMTLKLDFVRNGGAWLVSSLDGDGLISPR